MNIEKIKYFLNLIDHGVDVLNPNEEDGIEPLDVGMLLERLAILEAAVAFKGFDELPEGGPFRIIELRRANGKINKVDKINFDRYKNNPDFTGWRYPVGDLSE